MGLALVQTARSFDPARKVPFATLFRRRARGAVQDVCRKTLLMGFRRYGRESAGEPPELMPLDGYADTLPFRESSKE